MADNDRSLEAVDSPTIKRAGNAYEFPTSATVAVSSGDNDRSAKG